MPPPRSASAIEALSRLDRSRELPYVRSLTALHRSMLLRFDRDLDAIEELMRDIRATGATPEPWLVMRHERTLRLLDNYEQYVKDLVAQADKWTRNQATAGQEMLNAARSALQDQVATVPGLGDAAGVRIQDAFQAMDREGFGELLDETRSTRTRNLLSSLAGAARDEVAEELLYGLASGRSFKDTARNVRKVANAPLARALTITRTEGMRAQREALRTAYQRSDVTRGWIWWATGDQRTCFLCLARHGEKYPATREMVSHPNCRCSMLPDLRPPEDFGLQAKPWDDPDHGTIQETGEDLLAQMPEADQRRILGNERYEMWKKGDVELPELWREVDRGRYSNLEAVPLSDLRRQAGYPDPVSRETPGPGDAADVRAPIDPNSPEFRPLPKEPNLPDRGPAWRSTAKGQRVPEVEDAVEQASNQARQLLDLPDLPNTIVYRRIRGNAQGGYYIEDRDIEIDVRVPPDTAAHYYQHELGHFIDGHLGAGFDQAVGRAVVRNTPHRTELLKALKDTEAFRGLSRILQNPALHSQRKYAKYMASDNELMARVLAQYIAYKVDGRGMAGFKETVARRLAVGCESDQFYAFSPEDMRRLYPAIEKYLRTIGVLK